MNNEDWWGIVRWCDEDVENALELGEIEPTKENVAKVRNMIERHITDFMIECGWEMIYDAIDSLVCTGEIERMCEA